MHGTSLSPAPASRHETVNGGRTVAGIVSGIRSDVPVRSPVTSGGA